MVICNEKDRNIKIYKVSLFKFLFVFLLFLKNDDSNPQQLNILEKMANLSIKNQIILPVLKRNWKEYWNVSFFVYRKDLHGNIDMYLFLTLFSGFFASRHGCSSPRGISWNIGHIYYSNVNHQLFNLYDIKQVILYIKTNSHCIHL